MRAGLENSAYVSLADMLQSEHALRSGCRQWAPVRSASRNPSQLRFPPPLPGLLPHIRLHQPHQLAHRPSLLQIPDRILQFLLRPIRQYSFRQRRELLFNLGIASKRIPRIALGIIQLLA